MKTIVYTQVLQRSVKIEVSEALYLTLTQGAQIDAPERIAAVQHVENQAVDRLADAEMEHMSICVEDADGNELRGFE